MSKRDFTLLGFCCATLMLSAACNGSDAAVRIGNAFVATPVAQFEEPWAMTFLPDGRLLVTEKKGALKLLNLESKQVGNVSGVPKVAYGGQGGFGDVILHPQYASNSIVYVSYSEPGDGPGENDTNGAAVARAKLVLNSSGGGALQDFAVIWRQVPKVASRGHWGHRLAFGPDGKLWTLRASASSSRRRRT